MRALKEDALIMHPELKTAGESRDRPSPDTDPVPLDFEDKRVLCRHCMNHIADRDSMISINGTDVHLFKNPAGIFFRVICFSCADGAMPVSEYTSEFTWFDGYEWSPVICRRCRRHLGWHYRGSGEFFGLIADKLTGI